jgi:putative transposase
MSRIQRHSSFENVQASARTFFVTSQAFERRNLFQSERMAPLLIDVLKSNWQQNRFQLHDNVVTPNHFHALLTLADGISIEKAVQYIKGGFSFRAKKEGIYTREVWQVGFTETQVYDIQQYEVRRNYIYLNPVRRGLVLNAEEFPFSSVREKLAPRPQHLRG